MLDTPLAHRNTKFQKISNVNKFSNMLMDLEHSLDEVDHAALGVGHLPVLGQRLLTLVSRQHAPGPEVHGTAGLCVARDGLPPIVAFFMLCNQKTGTVWVDEEMQVHNAYLRQAALSHITSGDERKSV